MRVLKRIKERRGFSLAELLIVVAIIAILLAVAIPNVLSYYRELKITELDDDARTIFLAAQNQLTALSNSGDKLDSIGVKITNSNRLDPAVAHPELRYVEYQAGAVSTAAAPTTPNPTEGLRKILPGGSVDTHFHKYNYVIEFDTESGAVYGVWYWEKDGFEYNTHGITKYQDKQSRLKDNVMVGFYGGDQIDRLQFSQLPYPTVQLINAEELRLVIGVPDELGKATGFANANVRFDVFINDKDGKQIALVEDAYLYYEKTGTVVLDTLKTSEYTDDPKADTDADWTVGMKYKSWVKKFESTDTLPTPGDDITLTVKMSYTGEIDGKSLTPSTLVVTGNSLFEKVEVDSMGNKTASIAYGRHLQNLHDSGTSSSTGEFCSGVKDNDKITKAVQTKDINFNASNPDGTSKPENDVYYWASIYPNADPTDEDPYMSLHPINNNNLTGYDGGNHEIRNMDTSRYKYGGLFSCIAKAGTYANINIINPHVHLDKDATDVTDPNTWKDPDGNDATMYAGALVGWVRMSNSADKLTISNCHVYNDYREGDDPIGVGYLLDKVTYGEYNDTITDPAKKVSGPFNMNGFILYDGSGNVVSDPLTADKLYAKRLMGLPHIGAPVKGSISGGMVGFVQSGNIKIDNSSASVINIGAKYSGGLIGVANGTVEINNSYSAGFTYGNREVGGLIGYAAGNEITVSNCYAAGEIMNGYTKGFKGAGLFHYDNTTVTSLTVNNCYATIRYINADGLPKKDDWVVPGVYSTVGTIYGTYAQDYGTNNNFYVKQNGVRYGYNDFNDTNKFIDCGTAVTTAELTAKVTSSGNWSTTTGTTANTHAYKLLTETEDLEAYPYPMLNGTLLGTVQPHYGDWLEEDAATFALAYWERYENDATGKARYGVYGSQLDPGSGLSTLINTLLNPKVDPIDKNYAMADGYGVIVKREGSADTSEPMVTDNAGAAITFAATIRNIDVNGAAYDLYVINPTTSAPTDYYTEITVNSDKFYYNPGFACEVFEKQDGFDPATPKKKDKVDGGESGTKNVDDNGVVIRTARQLANLATYTNAAGSAATGWSYHQFLDIDYSQYTGAATGSTGTFNTGKDGTPQAPALLSGGTYTGNTFQISNLYIKAGTDGTGLFAKAENSSTIEGVRLVNVTVTGGTTVTGGLVGVLNNATVRDSGIYVDHELADSTTVPDDNDAYTTFTVTGDTTVGGLVGKVEGTSVLTGSFAAVQVTGGTTAGGLVGTMSGTVNVTSCYAGGHTVSGAYDKNAPNVTGTTVGGFAGEIDTGAAVTFSGINYSTCSVGKGTAMGLFIGSGTATKSTASGSELYATGTAFDKDGNQATATAESYLTTGNAIPRGTLTDAQTYNYDTTFNGLAYPYATNLDEHHGDWVTFPMAAYIEKYQIGTTTEYGAYAASVDATNKVEVTLNTLKSKAALGTGYVVDDFYRILSPQQLTTNYSIDSGTEAALELDTNFTFGGIPGTYQFDGQTYYIYKFDTSTATINSTYYHILTLGGYTFYINPDFGLEAYAAASATAPTVPLSKPQAAGKNNDKSVADLDDYSTTKTQEAKDVVIRSARQLANMQAYTNHTTATISDPAQKWTYDQLLNVDFSTYEGKDLAGTDILGKETGTRLTPAVLSSGNYYGHDNTISNLYLGTVTTSSGTYAGLFGSVAGGSVSHVLLVDVDVKGDNATTGNALAVGGLIGQLNGGTVDSCGIYASNATNYTTHTVTGSGENGVGGLIGQIFTSGSGTSTVKDSFAAVMVQGTGSTYNPVGGLIGQISPGTATITNCYVGGFVGTSKTYETGSVNVSGNNNVGGFVGSVTGTVTFTGTNYSTASVGGPNESTIGLFAGAGAITKPAGTDDKLYAVAKAFNTTDNKVVAPRDEGTYLVDPEIDTSASLTKDHYNMDGEAYPYPVADGQNTHHGDWILVKATGLYYDTVNSAPSTGYYASGKTISGNGYIGLITGAAPGTTVATDDGYIFLTTTDMGPLAINVGGQSYTLEKEDISSSPLKVNNIEYNYKYKVPAPALNVVTNHYYTVVSLAGRMFTVNFSFAGEIFDGETEVGELDKIREKSGLTYSDGTGGSKDLTGSAGAGYDGVVIRSARQLANLGIRSNMGTYTGNVKDYTPAANAIQAAQITQTLNIDYNKYATTDKMPEPAVLDGSNADANHTPITLAGKGYDGKNYQIRNLIPGMVRFYDNAASKAYVESGLFAHITEGTLQNVTLINAKVDNDAGTVTGYVEEDVPGVYVLDIGRDLIAGTYTKGTKKEKRGTDGYFTVIWKETGDSTVSNNKKLEWSFGGSTVYSSNTYLSFGGGTNYKSSAVTFTTEGPATIKVWWGKNKTDNKIYLSKLNSRGNGLTAVDNKEDTSEGGRFSVFKVSSSGTYYLGNTDENVPYIYRVEVYYPALTSVDESNQTPCSRSTPPYDGSTDPDYDGFPTGLTTADYQVRFGALLGASNPSDTTTTDGTVTIKNCGVYVVPVDTSGNEITNPDTEAYTTSYEDFVVTNSGASAEDAVGGLIGAAGDGTLIDTCFAAVKVSGNEKVGGFIGLLENATVNDSYSGGHTVKGVYETENGDDFNVYARSGYAGGFAGYISNTGARDNLKFEGVCYSTCSASGTIAGEFVGDINDPNAYDKDNRWNGFNPAKDENNNVYGMGAVLSEKDPTSVVYDYMDVTVNLHAYGYNLKAPAHPYDVDVLDDPTMTDKSYPYIMAGTQDHHGDWPMRFNLIYYELYKDEPKPVKTDIPDKESSVDTFEPRDFKLSSADKAKFGGEADYIGFYGVLPNGNDTDGRVINTLRVNGKVYDSGYMIVSDASIDDILMSITVRYVNNQDKATYKEKTGNDYGDDGFEFPYDEQPSHDTNIRTTGKINFADPNGTGTPYSIPTGNSKDTETDASKLIAKYGYVIPTEGLLLPPASRDFYLQVTINGQTYIFNPQFPCEAINVGVDLWDDISIKNKINYEQIRTKYGMNYVEILEDGTTKLHLDEDLKDTLLIRSPLNLAGMTRFSRESNTGLVKDKIVKYQFMQLMDVDYEYYAENRVYDGYTKNREAQKDGSNDKKDEFDNTIYNYFTGTKTGYGQVPAVLKGGKYNGLNHTISNLWLSNDSSQTNRIGLFGVLQDNAEVKNVKMENIHVESGRNMSEDDQDKKVNVGALAANVTDSTIENVTINGVTITLDDTINDGGRRKPKYDSIGGAIGNITGSAVTGSTSSASVSNVTVIDPKITVNTAVNNIKVGGVIGSADGSTFTYDASAPATDTRSVTITNSGVYMSETNKSKFDTMGVKASGDKLSGDEVGGFAGFIGKGVNVTGDYSAIRVQGKSMAGGFAGHIQGSHVENCYSGGYLESSGSGYSNTNYNVVADATNGTAGGFAGQIQVAYRSGSSGPMAMVMTGVNYTTSSASGKTVGKFAGEAKDADALAAKMGVKAPDNYACGDVKVASGGKKNEEPTVKTGSAIPRQDNTTGFTTYPYNATSSFPFKTNLSEHHGDWLESKLMAVGYWEVEDGKVRLWYVTSDAPTTPVVEKEAGALDFDHAPDGGRITDSGYFVVSSDTTATFTGSTGLTPETTHAEAVKKLLGGDKVKVEVYQLATGKAVQEWRVNSETFYVNPSYARAVEYKKAGMTASTLGSAAKPYEIRTVQQLANIGTDNDEHFKQSHDVVFATGDSYTSITSFQGNYDGGEYRILDINKPVFNELANGASIHNVIVYAPEGYDSVTFTGQGGIANKSSGVNVTISNTIVAGFTIGEGDNAGGLVGEVTGGELTIKNSEATNKLNGHNSGGLVGSVGSGGTLTITNSYAGGTITSSANTSAGGLVGGTGANVTYKDVYSYVDMTAITSSIHIYGIGPGTVDPSSVLQEYWRDGLKGKTARDTGANITAVAVAQLKLDTQNRNSTDNSVSVEEFVVPNATDRDNGLTNKAAEAKNDTDKFAQFPFAAFATGADGKNYHYGAFPAEMKYAGLFYWEKEVVNGVASYHYYAYGGEINGNTLSAQKLLDTLCYDHHLNGERASIEASGYGVFWTAGTDADITLKRGSTEIKPSDLSDLSDLNVINGLQALPGFSDATVKALPSGTSTNAVDYWTLGATSSTGDSIQVYPAFGAAIEEKIGKDGLGGDGEDMPLQIRTIQQLQNLGSTTTATGIPEFAITHDIDGSKTTDFNPISNDIKKFNGNGYRILDLNITPTSGDAALFSNITDNCVIKNVILYSTDGKGVITSTVGNAAGIVATGNNKKVQIEGCVVAGYTITGGSGKSIGGIVGESTGSNDSYIKNCQAIVTLDGTGGATNIGGIAGKFRGQTSKNGGIVDCYAGGSVVKATSSATVGGISGGMGNNNNLDIKDSYSYMNLLNTGADSGNVYAIVGDSSSKATVTTSYYLKDYLPTGAVTTSQGTGKTFEEMMTAKDTTAKYVYVPVDDVADTNKVKGLTSWGSDMYPFAAKVKVNVKAGVDKGETTGTVTVHYGAWPDVAGIAYWMKDTDGHYTVQIVGVNLLGEKLPEKLSVITEPSGMIEASGYAVIMGSGKLKVTPDNRFKTNGIVNSDKDNVINAINKALKDAGVDGICTSANTTVYDNKYLVGALDVTATVKIDEGTGPVDYSGVTLYFNPGMSGVAYEEFAGTTGSKEFKIHTAAELDAIPDSGTSGYTFKQMCDINAKDYEGYTGALGFAGKYDGQGYRILELNIGPDKSATDSKDAKNCAGLFATAGGVGCEIKNVVMYSPSGNAKIIGGTEQGSDDNAYGVGGIIGRLTGGNNATKVTNCVVAGYTISGMDYVGGIVGYAYHGGTIANCASVNTIQGKVDGEDDNATAVGGIVGGGDNGSANYKITINNCYVGGTIKDCGTNKVVGGVYGQNTESSNVTVENSYVYVNMSKCGTAKVYTICGDANGTFSNKNYYLNDTSRYPGGYTAQGTAKSYADLAASNASTTLFGSASKFGEAKESYVPTGKTAGGTKSTNGETAQSENFPFPEVVRKVDPTTGKVTDEYVHYGEWPADSTTTPTGSPGIPEGPGMISAPLEALVPPALELPNETREADPEADGHTQVVRRRTQAVSVRRLTRRAQEI